MEKVPVLFIIFNNISFIKRCFAPIRDYRPNKLFIACDGARKDRVGELEKINEVRDYVLTSVDWDCEVKTMFLDTNIGPAKAIHSFLKWYFSFVDYGIILEHDCLVHRDFFDFCAEMLIRYKDNKDIYTVSGYNVLGKSNVKNSYFFTYTQQLWAWGAWKRTVEDYDIYLKDYSLEEFERNADKVLKFKHEKQAFKEKFLSMKKQGYNTWDIQLLFYTWRHGGKNIEPKCNLVSNIGFVSDSLHSKNTNSFLSNNETYPILPLSHPTDTEVNDEEEEKIYKKFWYKSYLQLIARKIDRLFFMKSKF
ncbi:MAG: hypothetical protein IJ748_01875 [Bacteroidales bacterium]|nr:hypothetical protein [Bacteroidales bacterium]